MEIRSSEQSPHEWHECPDKRQQMAPSSLPPGEDPERRGPSMNQEGGSHLTSNLLAPDVGLPASGTMGHKCLSFKPLVCDVPLKQAELRQRGRGRSQNHSKIM